MAGAALSVISAISVGNKKNHILREMKTHILCEA